MILDYLKSFLTMTPMQIVGNVFSFISMVLAFISYQARKPRTLLFIQTGATLATVVSFFFLGAYTGMLLNVVCVIRNLIYCYRDKKIFHYAFWPYLLAALMAGLGALSWDGPHCLLIIVALAINTIFLSLNNNQWLRWSILLTSSMILVYDFLVKNVGGMGNESVAIISSVIGLLRFAGTKKEKTETQK